MPFTEFETARIEAAMSDFMAKRRPPPEIQDNDLNRIILNSCGDFWDYFSLL
jgi:hypothetical protein